VILAVITRAAETDAYSAILWLGRTPLTYTNDEKWTELRRQLRAAGLALANTANDDEKK